MNLNNIFNFKNKIILITGCNGQVGQALCNLYSDLKAKVYAVDLHQKCLIKRKEINYIKCNLSFEKNIKNTLKKIFKKEGKIDIIINNAADAVFSNFKKRTEKEISQIFNINASSVIKIIKNYTILFDQKKLKKGNILNVGSIYGTLSPDFNIYSKGDRFSSEIYGASKSSVIQVTKYFAVLLAGRNININCLSPGGILNKKKQSQKFINSYRKNVPLKRMANIEDIFSGVLYLTSDSSSYITGQNIVIDGGLSLK
tara:strand:- start:164 stop:931 length:768 start_codon:yes stop_codon:yes gene_type:complete